jgi:Ca2+/Na+ antiporter
MLDVPAMIGVTLALLALVAWRGAISRPVGFAMLAAYAAYTAALGLGVTG